ncbi:SCAN domain-containing protein 3 [Trichonephila clavata]|uniref:SCAN domain-containing protein 3 n=1 Tax=Trichonephila clavata TaxID=2740835 RepID=A0A8X6M5Q9_TRICU|nr:SCAN domain-containing protein 3 [Trichonephila clavata]
MVYEELETTTEEIHEDLIKPSISAFLKTVLEKDDNAVKAMPLSNNIVSIITDQMSDDNETQLVEKLKSRYFSLQMDESTRRDSEIVLSISARYIDKSEFAEEMLRQPMLVDMSDISMQYQEESSEIQNSTKSARKLL